MKLFISMIIFILSITFKQDGTLIKLDGKPDIFTTDKFGNVYVYFDNVLKKYTSEGNINAQYSSNSFGHINSIDVSDPMQIIVHYKDFNMLILLDNQLAPLGKSLYFDRIGLSSVGAVCKSKQFGVWLFDNYQQKLVLYSFNPVGIIRTINMAKYSKPLPNIVNIFEYGSEIYLYQKGNAIWVFDESGGKVRILDVHPKTGFQISSNRIIYSDQEHILFYNLNTGSTDSLAVNGFSHFDRARIEIQKLFVLHNDSIQILPLK